MGFLRKDKKMTIHVKGMSCEHCEKRVAEAVNGVSGVKSASADHEAGQVEIRVERNAKVDEEKIKTAVTDAGYIIVE